MLALDLSLALLEHATREQQPVTTDFAQSPEHKLYIMRVDFKRCGDIEIEAPVIVRICTMVAQKIPLPLVYPLDKSVISKSTVPNRVAVFDRFNYPSTLQLVVLIGTTPGKDGKNLMPGHGEFPNEPVASQQTTAGRKHLCSKP